MSFVVFNAISSVADRYGNVYHAIEVTNKVNGVTVAATVSGDNARGAIFEYVGWDWECVRGFCEYHEARYSVREFNAFTKNLPHAGCTGQQIAEFLKDNQALPGFWDCVEYLRDEFGMDVSGHESDLYLPATPQVKMIIHAFRMQGSLFTNQINGKLYFDIPFANQDWWTRKMQGARSC